MDIILMGGRPKDSQLSRYHVKSIFLTQPRLGGTFMHSTRIHLGSAPSRMYLIVQVRKYILLDVYTAKIIKCSKGIFVQEVIIK